MTQYQLSHNILQVFIYSFMNNILHTNLFKIQTLGKHTSVPKNPYFKISQSTVYVLLLHQI